MVEIKPKDMYNKFEISCWGFHKHPAKNIRNFPVLFSRLESLANWCMISWIEAADERFATKNKSFSNIRWVDRGLWQWWCSWKDFA